MHETTTLRGARVVLRPADEEDVAALAAILAEPAVRERWGRHDEARVRAELVEHEAGLAIVLDGATIGWIGVEAEEEPDYRHAGIDLFIATAHHGRGLGPEAIRLVVREWTARGHHRFTIDPSADNEQAIRAYAAVGFKPVGRMRAYERAPDGSWHDSLLMDLLADELIE